MIPIPRIASTAALLGLLTPFSDAQGLLYEWPQEYCETVAPAGDVDADGIDDYAVCEGGGAPEDRVVHVYSGRNGEEILSIRVGGAPGVAAMGDVDLDGHADLAVRGLHVPTWNCFISLVSGATGTRLWQYTPPPGPPYVGYALTAVGDLDHDGVSELALGLLEPYDSTLAGQVVVLSGATGTVHARVGSVLGATQSFGGRVCAAGDLDLDGVPDFLVADSRFSDWRGRVTAHSGVDARPILSVEGPVESGQFGAALVSIGDVTGDGVPDFAVGAPAEPVSTGTRLGRVRVFSGADGATVLAFAGESNDRKFGHHLDSFQDLDGDGRLDLLVASGNRCAGGGDFWTCWGGDLRVYSSATGAILYVGTGQDSWAAVVPDANGDGVVDYLLPWAALALTGLPGPREEACPPTTTSLGCSALMAHGGAPSLSLGPNFELLVPRLPENTTGFFAWSLSQVQLPMGNSWLCLGTPLHRLATVTATLGEEPCAAGGPSTGTLSISFTKQQLANLGPAVGARFYVQCWFRDPGSAPPDDFGLSSVLSLVLWP